MDVYIGLDIGGTKILGAMYDMSGNVIERVKKKTKAAEGVDKVIEQIYKVVDTLLEKRDITLLGIGAGCPGIVLEETLVTFSPNIPFKDFNLGVLIKDRYDVPLSLAMMSMWQCLVSGKQPILQDLRIFLAFLLVQA